MYDTDWLYVQVMFTSGGLGSPQIPNFNFPPKLTFTIRAGQYYTSADWLRLYYGGWSSSTYIN